MTSSGPTGNCSVACAATESDFPETNLFSSGESQLNLPEPAAKVPR